MKITITIIAALVLAGCEPRDDAPATIKPADRHDRNLTRWGPDEYGVVCYRQTGMEGISCLKVQPPVQHKEGA